MSASEHFSYQQKARLGRFGVERCVDLHCHCLPGVDDGPPTVEDALAVCRLLVRDGFTDAVATPHELGRWDGTNWAESIRPVVAKMNEELTRHRVPLTIHAGAEVRIDERIPKLLAADRVLTLADAKKYLLLELPTSMMVHPETAMRILAGRGEAAALPALILAHVERYEAISRDHGLARGWIEQGVALQVNASSLIGPATSDGTKAAWAFVGKGWASLVATDSHSVGSRRPRMTDAIDLIAQRFGEAMAKQICVENPLRVLAGEPLPKIDLPAESPAGEIPRAGDEAGTGKLGTRGR